MPDSDHCRLASALTPSGVLPVLGLPSGYIASRVRAAKSEAVEIIGSQDFLPADSSSVRE
jgi:hypothetical protein